jgi:hypothetical protein
MPWYIDLRGLLTFPTMQELQRVKTNSGGPQRSRGRSENLVAEPDEGGWQ